MSSRTITLIGMDSYIGITRAQHHKAAHYTQSPLPKVLCQLSSKKARFPLVPLRNGT